MKKRFLTREVLLLTVPVLALGAVGWWVAKRPVRSVDEGRPVLSLRVVAPTTMEAFDGVEGVFEVSLRDTTAKEGRGEDLGGVIRGLRSASPYLELQTGQRVQVSRRRGGSSRLWGRVWRGTASDSRIGFDLRSVPAGTLSFGFDGLVQPLVGLVGTPLPAPMRVSGKWKVDRAKIPRLNLAAMPRRPWVVLRSVKVNGVRSFKSSSQMPSCQVTGEAVFELQSASMNERTPLDDYFSANQWINSAPGIPYDMTWGNVGAKNKSKASGPRRRVQEWQADIGSISDSVQVTGRVSADNRWPLGFEVEPFRVRDLKVGQKLRFKSFAAALPDG